MSSKVILDASALLCLLNDEPGADRVGEILMASPHTVTAPPLPFRHYI